MGDTPLHVAAASGLLSCVEVNCTINQKCICDVIASTYFDGTFKAIVLSLGTFLCAYTFMVHTIFPRVV